MKKSRELELFSHFSSSLAPSPNDSRLQEDKVPDLADIVPKARTFSCKLDSNLGHRMTKTRQPKILARVSFIEEIR